jgi:hypothetical protein
MLLNMTFFATPSYETRVPTLIGQLQQRLRDVSYIIPFDKTYDEDTLNGCYEKLEIVEACIQEVYKKRIIDNSKLQQFMVKKENIETEIEVLLLQREIKYAEWKKEVLRIGDETTKITNHIKELYGIEKEIHKLFLNKHKGRREALMAAMFHNMVNTLLTLSSYEKENMPLLAFASAFKKGLIDANVYNKLAKLA